MFVNRLTNQLSEMFDRDRTMTINVYEFRDLFNYINQWKGLFESIDRDRSGFIEFNELQQGVLTFSFYLDLQISLTRTRPERSMLTSSGSSSLTLTSGRASLSPSIKIGPAESSRKS